MIGDKATRVKAVELVVGILDSEIGRRHEAIERRDGIIDQKRRQIQVLKNLLRRGTERSERKDAEIARLMEALNNLYSVVMAKHPAWTNGDMRIIREAKEALTGGAE